MIVHTFIWLTFLGVLHCYPNPRKFNIPNIDVSTPEEVNSLEQEEPLQRSIDPQKSPDNNIDHTVKQVENILKSNPALPRLTRGEILDLLENITVTDAQKTEILGRNRNPKAVMVVMPYTPSNDKNMEDLYTKAPVTHIIGAEPFKTKEEVSKEKHFRRRPPVQFNDTDNDLAQKPLPPQEKKKYSATINEKPVRTPVRRKRPEATTQATPTTYHPPTRKPIRRRTTTQHPNHRYEFKPNEGIKIIESPKLDLDIQENIRHEVVVPFRASTTTTPLIHDINFPDNLKPVVKDLNLGEADKLRASLEEQNRIKSILASIGILPGTTTTTTTTTTTSVPSAENVIDSLSPDMRELLISYGLLPKPNQKPVQNYPDTFYPEKAEVKPESYINFKPLPDDGPSRDDMDALLASFGLGRSARKEKSLKIDKIDDEETLTLDMIPDQYKGIITDLGIDKIEPEPKKEKQHVFNPDAQYATEEELQKLEKLMKVIKQLEKLNGTATDEDLKQIDLEGLKELVSSLNSYNETLTTLEDQENSPDPTAFDVGLVKNEVKRQESTTTEATTTESQTPNLKDLEESFGGQTEPPTLPPIPETTTSRSGFYYLVDWNTFLDIDDTKGKRVNLRFQPTIGDPKRFLSVSVP